MKKDKPQKTKVTCIVCGKQLADYEVFFNGDYCNKHKPPTKPKKIQIQ